jgi:hypothetical protein
MEAGDLGEVLRRDLNRRQNFDTGVSLIQATAFVETRACGSSIFHLPPPIPYPLALAHRSRFPMSHRSALPAAALALLSAVAALAAPPPAECWTRFKPGTFVKVRTVAKFSGEEMVEETKFTLTEVTADFYKLRIETSMGGNALPLAETTFPLGPTAAGEWAWEEKGEEELEVDGQKLKCKVRHGTSGDKYGAKKVWTAEVDGVPMDIKVEEKRTVPGGARTETSVVKKLSDTVKVAGKDVKCWVREVVLDIDGEKTESTIWESREMPGQTVRSEQRLPTGALAMTTTREVVEFEVK